MNWRPFIDLFETSAQPAGTGGERIGARLFGKCAADVTTEAAKGKAERGAPGRQAPAGKTLERLIANFPRAAGAGRRLDMRS